MVSISMKSGERNLRLIMVLGYSSYSLISGIAVNQFPNYLIMFGPNSGAPWANLTTTFEIQANYIVRAIRHIRRQETRSGAPYAIMVEAGVQKRFTEWIQANMGPLA